MTNTVLPRALEGSNAGPGAENARAAVYWSTNAPAAVATLLCAPALEEAELLVLLQLAASRVAAAARASAAVDATRRLLMELSFRADEICGCRGVSPDGPGI